MPRAAAIVIFPLAAATAWLLLVVPPQALADEVAPAIPAAAMADDDECLAAAPGASGASGGTCSLSALQLHGRVQAQAVAGGGVHAAAMGALERISHGLQSLEALRASKGEQDDGSSDDSCKELMASMQSCVPQSTKPSEMTSADVQTMCGCQGLFTKLKACPDPTAQMVADLELKLLSALCSPCGLSIVKMVFSSTCVTQSGGHTQVKWGELCSADCHTTACGMLTECTEGHGLGGMISASDIAEMRKNITEATQKCGCSSL